MESGQDLNAALTPGTSFEQDEAQFVSARDPFARTVRVNCRTVALTLGAAILLAAALPLRSSAPAAPAVLVAEAAVSDAPPETQSEGEGSDSPDFSGWSCGNDLAAVEAPRIYRTSKTWTQQTSQVVRVKLWGGGGMGGAPVRLKSDDDCRVRRSRRLRRADKRRADLNNRANQLNPNNWRYWASRGMQPPWRRAGNIYQGGSAGRGTRGGAALPLQNGQVPLGPPSYGLPPAPPPPGPTDSSELRGQPLRLVRRAAQKAHRAARKWLPRERRWKVTQEDPTTIGPCGELWLCGGGGGGGAFTDRLVNLTAGRVYELQVGLGGFPGAPHGLATRLMEHLPGGRRLLAEAAGGLGAVAVDEERLLALGGLGATKGDLKGVDGEASRSDLQGLQTQRLVLTGADLTKRQARATAPFDDFAAIRVPCAGGAGMDSLERRAGFTETLLGMPILESNPPPPPAPPSFEPSEHMLVCLPSAAGAYNYPPKLFAKGSEMLLNPRCAEIAKLIPRLFERARQQYMSGPPNMRVRIESFEGHQALVRVVESVATFKFLNGPPPGFSQSSWSWQRSPGLIEQNGEMYLKLNLTAAATCVSSIPSLNGSQCIGVACLRSKPGAPCQALPSCTAGLQSHCQKMALTQGFPFCPWVSR
ncbi:unnamed protein product [Effrenium voratum]|nr:unnamed protein product [Effrenium voratum]